jgi:hypothetical protein
MAVAIFASFCSFSLCARASCSRRLYRRLSENTQLFLFALRYARYAYIYIYVCVCVHTFIVYFMSPFHLYIVIVIVFFLILVPLGSTSSDSQVDCPLRAQVFLCMRCGPICCSVRPVRAQQSQTSTRDLAAQVRLQLEHRANERGDSRIRTPDDFHHQNEDPVLYRLSYLTSLYVHVFIVP